MSRQSLYRELRRLGIGEANRNDGEKLAETIIRRLAQLAQQMPLWDRPTLDRFITAEAALVNRQRLFRSHYAVLGGNTWLDNCFTLSNPAIISPSVNGMGNRRFNIQNVKLLQKGSDYVRPWSHSFFFEQERRFPERAHETIFKCNIRIKLILKYIFQNGDPIFTPNHICTYIVPEISISRIASIICSVPYEATTPQRCSNCGVDGFQCFIAWLEPRHYEYVPGVICALASVVVLETFLAIR